MIMQKLRALAISAVTVFILMGSGRLAQSQTACTPRADWNSQYSVGLNDNLSRIAQIFGLSTGDLANGNCILNPNVIYVGQVLQVPAINGVNRIAFQVGAITANVQSQLSAAGMDKWVLGAQAGQTLTVQLTANGGKNILIVYGADGNVLLSDHADATSFSGVLPTTQDYRVDVRGDASVPTAYTMSVTIPPLPLPTNVPPLTQRITFAPNAVAAAVQGTLTPTGVDRWTLRVLARQTLSAQLALTTGYGVLIVYGADGTVLQTDHSGSYSFSSVVPSTQDYILAVRGNGVSAANYTLSVYIPPLP